MRRATTSQRAVMPKESRAESLAARHAVAESPARARAKAKVNKARAKASRAKAKAAKAKPSRVKVSRVKVSRAKVSRAKVKASRPKAKAAKAKLSRAKMAVRLLARQTSPVPRQRVMEDKLASVARLVVPNRVVVRVTPTHHSTVVTWNGAIRILSMPAMPLISRSSTCGTRSLVAEPRCSMSLGGPPNKPGPFLAGGSR